MSYTNIKDKQSDKGRFRHNPKQLTSFDNNAEYNYVSIMSGLYIIESLYGDTPDEDDYLDHAYNCMRHIGNVHIDLYGFTGTTDDNGELCLPVEALGIEYVTNGSADWTTISVVSEISQLHPPGNFVAYKFVGDRVITDWFNQNISVAYWNAKTDEEGYLMITEQEAEACAYWWKWVDTRRKMHRGNQLARSLIKDVTFDKNKSINQARVPERFSQNFLDQLADIYVSKDRKIYNRSFKPVTTA